MKRIVFLVFVGILMFFPAAPAHSSGFGDIVIEGFSFEKLAYGKKVFSLVADKATFGNKRIGFFDIGISKVMLLENACFILYRNGDIVKKQCFKQATYELNTSRLLDEEGKVVFCEQELLKQE